jgi:hypothetical protein
MVSTAVLHSQTARSYLVVEINPALVSTRIRVSAAMTADVHSLINGAALRHLVGDAKDIRPWII